MRRRAGVGAIHKQKLEAEKYKDKGSEIQDNQFEQMTKQMEFLKANLKEFARICREAQERDQEESNVSTTVHRDVRCYWVSS